MQIPDLVNGLFECSGGLFIGMSIRQLYHDKIVRGVSWPHVAFFSSWGFWNLYFYPVIGQWLSFVGGAALVATNTFWLCQIVYYNRLNTEKAFAEAVEEADERDDAADEKCTAEHQEAYASVMPADDGPLDGKRYRHNDK